LVVVAGLTTLLWLLWWRTKNRKKAAGVRACVRLRGGGRGETLDLSDREASTTVDLTKRLIHSDSKGVPEGGKGEERG